MRNIMFVSLVVITSTTAVTTQLGAVTIDDFSVGHSFTAAVGFNTYTNYRDSFDSSIVTGERDLTVSGYKFFSDLRGTSFEANNGRAFISGVSLVGIGGPAEGNEWTYVELVYDGPDRSRDINVMNTPFDITDGGAHDRFLIDTLFHTEGLKIEMAFSPGDESEMFTLEKVISGPIRETLEFKFDDFIGRSPGLDTPSLVSFVSFRVIEIGTEDSFTFTKIYTGTGVPEPNSFLLLALGATIVFGRRSCRITRV